MAYNYDALYAQTPNALGDPTKVFVDFFQTFDKPNARILDVGCGQGRDALFIARLGHRVVGVDLSPSGIADMTNAATKENLQVEGTVADITKYSPKGTFDVLLIDRTLHMLDPAPRLRTLARLLDCVASGGWTLIEDERTNIADFKATAEDHKAQWDIMHENRGTLFLRRA